MIAVIFEVWPAEGQRQHYLDLAAALKADLQGRDGFISVERFESLTEPGKLLSLSIWRDEEAVRAWRCLPSHRVAQGEGRGKGGRGKDGRGGVFRDYRLRVASILRDYGLEQRDEAPDDSRAVHPPVV